MTTCTPCTRDSHATCEATTQQSCACVVCEAIRAEEREGRFAEWLEGAW